MDDNLQSHMDDCLAQPTIAAYSRLCCNVNSSLVIISQRDYNVSLGADNGLPAERVNFWTCSYFYLSISIDDNKEVLSDYARSNYREIVGMDYHDGCMIKYKLWIRAFKQMLGKVF